MKFIGWTQLLVQLRGFLLSSLGLEKQLHYTRFDGNLSHLWEITSNQLHLMCKTDNLCWSYSELVNGQHAQEYIIEPGY